ncbi:MAG: ribose 5-phosphate isomerase B [Endomicrobiales bacterium]|nr:ribose 5-phosphate isomerase B [Endomicrobiales bacterium]
MKIAFGCDHAGFEHKKGIVEFLRNEGHEVLDFGCNSADSCDYPDVAADVARTVSSGKADKGVLTCGTGVGMSIVANKSRGVRAGVCWNEKVAALISEHNDANVICLPARFASTDEMKKWIKIWLVTPQSPEERHKKRVEKILNIEKK